MAGINGKSDWGETDEYESPEPQLHIDFQGFLKVVCGSRRGGFQGPVRRQGTRGWARSGRSSVDTSRIGRGCNRRAIITSRPPRACDTYVHCASA